ncbi:ABC transporter substrate-binding protein [Vibrio inusitatus NBRC 102082]|uniref:ABC transporter substrate-binding protein n=1 Tax=Vibrio inusitatus NBRC 102082 TaxID=1219070 RepID=A0A4Y3HWR9_9VIBR|nr:tripartite tricarboxylate transporter substrate binding protein [Vibrio inusitatus]GEA51633.1 ABC transporter substrate-binding protein [Vibrio inusitatus NBRC 102082]
MIKKLKFAGLSIAAVLAGSMTLANVAVADDNFPRKPVSMVVAYSAGGGTDTAARVIAKHVEPHLGQRLVIQNKPGAGGQIGFSDLARSKNDGYKIGFINLPSLYMVKMLRNKVPYEFSDFEAIANIQIDPVVLAVNADSPYSSFEEFLAAAKANPGKINIGGDGPQSNNQLQLVIAQKKLGAEFNFVAFSGSGPAVTATLGNQVDASIPSATSVANHARNGRLKVLAVFADERFAYLPNVPTVKEVTGIEVPAVGASMRGVAVPKGTPEARKKSLELAFKKVMEDKEFLSYAEEVGMPLNYMSAQDFDEYLAKTAASVEQYIDLLK